MRVPRSAALCGGKSYVISDNDVLLQLAKARGLLDGAKSTETRPPCNDQTCKPEGLIMRDVARCAEDISSVLRRIRSHDIRDGHR